MEKTDFMYAYQFAGLTDIGKKRSSNQDRMILVPGNNFFAVSDGMGGLRHGEASAIYVSEIMPKLINICSEKCSSETSVEDAAEYLCSVVRTLSDELFKKGNTYDRFDYGATLAGVWLFRDRAVFVGLGDSRSYLLRGDDLLQVSEDMNIAGLLVRNGELTREEALHSPASSRLTAFVGMEPPAEPVAWMTDIQPGDRILMCSDGLYGMVPEKEMIRILKSGDDLNKVCRKLVDSANKHGGHDNISAVTVKIGEHK